MSKTVMILRNMIDGRKGSGEYNQLTIGQTVEVDDYKARQWVNKGYAIIPKKIETASIKTTGKAKNENRKNKRSRK